MADSILKIASSPYLTRELSEFNQIWSADTYFHYEDAFLTKKSKFFKFKMAEGRHIEYFWLYFGALLVYQREIRKGDEKISCSYWSHDQNGNFRKCKMADDRHFEDSFISINVKNLSV